ncbi:MAG: hypothetical protein Q8P59_08155 [Dehalococcoidia bacterium]|nr:hypothetical protein [Dehalococcoidia bacterium]
MSGQKLSQTIVALALPILLLAACAAPVTGPAAAPTSPAPSPKPLAAEALANAEYKTTFLPSGSVKLQEGVYREKVVPGAASEVVIRLSDFKASGDLDSDGVEDTAVVLVNSGGGSGTFFTLEAVLNQQGAPKHAASQLLGDRVKLNSLSIASGEVVVKMVTHGPTDPLCCPTQEVIQRYKLQGDKLTKLAAPQP